MKFYQCTISSLFLFVFSAAFCQAEESSWYDEPIVYNPNYSADIEAAILDALALRKWEVKGKSIGKITAWLNNYKGYELVLDIIYDGRVISFKHVSYKKVECKKICKAEQKYYDKWRLYLRKSLALNIHKLAMDALLKNDKIKTKWLNTFKNGTIEEKTKQVRNIIDLQYFEPDILRVIEEEVRSGGYKKKLSSKLVQQYAFYCKALASTKDAKYIPLLNEVRDTAKSKSLNRYLKKYLESFYGM